MVNLRKDSALAARIDRAVVLQLLAGTGAAAARLAVSKVQLSTALRVLSVPSRRRRVPYATSNIAELPPKLRN
jgi:hypothetical protein